MFPEVLLVRRGLITADQFVQAVEWQLDQRPRLGHLALQTGKLTMKQVFAVLEEQTVNDNPFGEIAVELGFLTKRQVTSLLKLQNDRVLPLSQCLIEIGAIDQDVFDRECGHFRHEQTAETFPTTVPRGTSFPVSQPTGVTGDLAAY
jgi:hypothetical protein